MEVITPVILLSTIFGGLVVVLYLYGRFNKYLYQRSPPVNKHRLKSWLLDNRIILPSKQDIINECNSLADDISSVEGGVKWQNLKIEKFLLNTSLPEFEILSIKSINDNQVSFKCCVSWPDCVPGIEVSMMLADEKITCHTQVDWMIMIADCTLTKLSDTSVSISWVQTKPPVSALSCMVTTPPRWKADIDITQPLLENPNTEASEGVASSVAEGVLKLIKSFQLKDYTIPNITSSDGVNGIETDYNNSNSDRTDLANGIVQNGDVKEVGQSCEDDNNRSPNNNNNKPNNNNNDKPDNNNDEDDDNIEEEWVIVKQIASDQENTNNVQENTNNVQENTNNVQENTNNVQENTNNVQVNTNNEQEITNIEQEITDNEQEITNSVQEVTEEITEYVQEVTKDMQEDPEDVQENTEANTEDIQANTEDIQESNGHDETKQTEATKQSETNERDEEENCRESDLADGKIDTQQETMNEPNGTLPTPVINDTPTIEETNSYSPSIRWHNQLPVIAEPLRDDSDETMPGLTVRSTYYEQVPIDDSPTPSPKALPTYLRALRYSEEDLSAPDKSPFDRAKTLSIRSYDTDSPMTDASGRFLSTVVFEVQDGSHKKHIVALNPAHANRLRKQLHRYTKLHIYNDHTFTAKHIKSKQACFNCGEKISGLFGKQAYVCRDCDMHTHKNCHHKTESNCTRSQVSTLSLVYPDHIGSYSLQ